MERGAVEYSAVGAVWSQWRQDPKDVEGVLGSKDTCMDERNDPATRCGM